MRLSISQDPLHLPAVRALPFCPHQDLVRSSLGFIPQISRQVNFSLASLSEKVIFELAIQNVANPHDVVLAVKLEDGDLLFLMKGLGGDFAEVVDDCHCVQTVFDCS